MPSRRWDGRGLLARLQLGDYRTSERQVREFSWPAGLNDDPTLTACGGFATRCARADVGPEAALRATATALADAGLRLGPVRCGPEAETSIWLSVPGVSDCTAEASAGGYSVHALATEYARTPSPSGALRLGYTQVSLVLNPENERLAALVEPTSVTGTRAPLPARAADVPGLPTLLKSLECTQPEGDGCRAFEGTIALPGSGTSSADATAATLADDLRVGGYYVQMRTCRDVDVGRRCTGPGHRRLFDERAESRVLGQHEHRYLRVPEAHIRQARSSHRVLRCERLDEEPALPRDGGAVELSPPAPQQPGVRLGATLHRPELQTRFSEGR